MAVLRRYRCAVGNGARSIVVCLLLNLAKRQHSHLHRLEDFPGVFGVAGWQETCLTWLEEIMLRCSLSRAMEVHLKFRHSRHLRLLKLRTSPDCISANVVRLVALLHEVSWLPIGRCRLVDLVRECVIGCEGTGGLLGPFLLVFHG